MLNMMFNFILYKRRNIPSIKLGFDCFLTEIENMLYVLRDNSIQKNDLNRFVMEAYTNNV